MEHTENLKWTPKKHAKHRAMMVARMADKVLRADKSKILADWNRSEDHKSRIRGEKHPRWNTLDVAGLEYLVLATGARGIHELMEKGRVGQSTIGRVLKTEALTWNQFAQKNIPGWEAKGRARHVTNHKVVSVRKTGEKLPVFDLTVEKHANFAVGAGIIVSNSMDDIEYFRDKLFAAMKVPKSYLGQDAGTARAVLSAEDVRFARTVLRVQRELRNGLRKVCRVHLSALNVDPASVDYDINMTVPSAVFELAQMEVRNARADLANRMREFVSLHWILSKVFDMSDSDIETIMAQRGGDVSRDQIAMASAQAASNAVMSGMPGSENPEDQPQPESSPADVAKALREGQILLSPTTRSRRHLPISEKELFTGSRESEKRAEDKLNQLLKSDKQLANRIEEMRGMLSDLKAVSGGRRR
jgi:hypothetical protein